MLKLDHAGLNVPAFLALFRMKIRQLLAEVANFKVADTTTFARWVVA